MLNGGVCRTTASSNLLVGPGKPRDPSVQTFSIFLDLYYSFPYQNPGTEITGYIDP